jgi:hypothetical protein
MNVTDRRKTEHLQLHRVEPKQITVALSDNEQYDSMYVHMLNYTEHILHVSCEIFDRFTTMKKELLELNKNSIHVSSFDIFYQLQ